MRSLTQIHEMDARVFASLASNSCKQRQTSVIYIYEGHYLELSYRVRHLNIPHNAVRKTFSAHEDNNSKAIVRSTSSYHKIFTVLKRVTRNYSKHVHVHECTYCGWSAPRCKLTSITTDITMVSYGRMGSQMLRQVALVTGAKTTMLACVGFLSSV